MPCWHRSGVLIYIVSRVPRTTSSFWGGVKYTRFGSESLTHDTHNLNASTSCRDASIHNWPHGAATARPPKTHYRTGLARLRPPPQLLPCTLRGIQLTGSVTLVRDEISRLLASGGNTTESQIKRIFSISVDRRAECSLDVSTEISPLTAGREHIGVFPSLACSVRARALSELSNTASRGGIKS